MARQQKITFPQRGRIRGRINEDVTVHGVRRQDGFRVYEVEFTDGIKADWIPSHVELLGPVDDDS